MLHKGHFVSGNVCFADNHVQGIHALLKAPNGLAALSQRKERVCFLRAMVFKGALREAREGK